MVRTRRIGLLATLALATGVAVSSSGCTSFRDYVRNGLKVGPNYCKPAAPVAEHWIDSPQVNESRGEDLSKWWLVFQDPVLRQPDPVLNHLIQTAYRQNLTLREAGMRVLQSRAQLAIARGNFFPQTQDAFGSYARNGASLNPPNGGGGFGGARFSDAWRWGFNLNWELDFWGRFRRAIASADDNLDASVEGYDAALVTLLGDVARAYVLMRTDQEQIRLSQENVELQQKIVDFLRKQAAVSYGKDIQLNKDQAEGTLAQTAATIPQFEIDLRQNNDALCVLLGMPSVDLREAIPVWKAVDGRKTEETQKVRNLLQQLLTSGGPQKEEDLQRLAKIVSPIYIPSAPEPKDVAVGIPADLLRRRPDVRQAERLAAAQGEQIGIAETDLYPSFFLNGTLGYSAGTFKDLFSQQAFNGSFGPSFQWNLLNYGRIVGNVRLQDARFQELVYAYQNSVIEADREVEDGLVNYLRSDQRRKLFAQGVRSLIDAVRYVTQQERVGQIDINRYSVIAQNLVQQEISWAQSHGDVNQGLIAVYRALGGGWEIRLGEAAPELPPSEILPAAPAEVERLPAPLPKAPVGIGEVIEPPTVPKSLPAPDQHPAPLPPKPDATP